MADANLVGNVQDEECERWVMSISSGGLAMDVNDLVGRDIE